MAVCAAHYTADKYGSFFSPCQILVEKFMFTDNLIFFLLWHLNGERQSVCPWRWLISQLFLQLTSIFLTRGWTTFRHINSWPWNFLERQSKQIWTNRSPDLRKQEQDNKVKCECVAFGELCSPQWAAMGAICCIESESYYCHTIQTTEITLQLGLWLYGIVCFNARFTEATVTETFQK